MTKPTNHLRRWLAIFCFFTSLLGLCFAVTMPVEPNGGFVALAACGLAISAEAIIRDRSIRLFH